MLNTKPQRIHLVCVYTGSVIYVTDPYKIEYRDMLNTVKMDPFRLKSKQSVPDELAKHNMPVTRSIASMLTRLKQHSHSKQNQLAERNTVLLNALIHHSQICSMGKTKVYCADDEI